MIMLQEAMLKEELRNMERMQKREGVDLTYLKNVILKLLETGILYFRLSVCSHLQLYLRFHDQLPIPRPPPCFNALWFHALT